MQITVKPIRTWLIGADIILVTIMSAKLCQQKYHFNIAIGIVLGIILGFLLTLLMKINRVGKVFQIGISYYWTTIILKFFGVTKNFKSKNEYYIIFGVILLILTMIHIAQVDDLKG